MRNFHVLVTVDARELCVRDRIAYVSLGIRSEDTSEMFLAPHFAPIHEVIQHRQHTEVIAVTVKIKIGGELREHKFKGDASVTIAADLIDVLDGLRDIESREEPEDDTDNSTIK